ncbi:hypothetical protein EXIGLDRAFT_31270 [Exidia glandulosa HHB12029]|uniref:Uncharacterized protein n=1 Tax=Exidia glandulosa HHB12029 TaxID=1314781 RepID=A0A166MW12_EXIGL|nr:hypothetical protein EXIGLDRAFT_31270 [Exidia glandulosa HHB12029]
MPESAEVLLLSCFGSVSILFDGRASRLFARARRSPGPAAMLVDAHGRDGERQTSGDVAAVARRRAPEPVKRVEMLLLSLVDAAGPFCLELTEPRAPSARSRGEDQTSGGAATKLQGAARPIGTFEWLRKNDVRSCSADEQLYMSTERAHDEKPREACLPTESIAADSYAQVSLDAECVRMESRPGRDPVLQRCVQGV